eukprot:TRINITY_DN219_c0_g2_i21.p1 TRINITY_DN219_c0_g2~~TRINITY_DN219_c0_g2_i21.p1  ORF type:complete len:334 (-),score=-63.00 TRINITY_DN219_c0_g2_i21:817-1818(-)
MNPRRGWGRRERRMTNDQTRFKQPEFEPTVVQQTAANRSKHESTKTRRKLSQTAEQSEASRTRLRWRAHTIICAGERAHADTAAHSRTTHTHTRTHAPPIVLRTHSHKHHLSSYTTLDWHTADTLAHSRLTGTQPSHWHGTLWPSSAIPRLLGNFDRCDSTARHTAALRTPGAAGDVRRSPHLLVGSFCSSCSCAYARTARKRTHATHTRTHPPHARTYAHTNLSDAHHTFRTHTHHARAHTHLTSAHTSTHARGQRATTSTRQPALRHSPHAHTHNHTRDAPHRFRACETRALANDAHQNNSSCRTRRSAGRRHQHRAHVVGVARPRPCCTP